MASRHTRRTCPPCHMANIAYHHKSRRHHNCGANTFRWVLETHFEMPSSSRRTPKTYHAHLKSANAIIVMGSGRRPIFDDHRTTHRSSSSSSTTNLIFIVVINGFGSNLESSTRAPKGLRHSIYIYMFYAKVLNDQFPIHRAYDCFPIAHHRSMCGVNRHSKDESHI